jgi:HMG (high mobility group) box/Topoisomerase C-terminal repeat
MDGAMVTVKSGRFGNYLNWKKVNAKLPAEYVDEPETMPLEEAWALIEEKAAQQPKAKKGSSKDSDLPPAPKRPKSAYMYFCADKRPEVAEKGKPLGDVAKELASMWSDISDEDRKKYDQVAEAGKQEYQKEKAVWKEECKKSKGSRGKKSSSSSKASSSEPTPKRPRSAYIFFCNALRPEVSERFSKLGDIAKELARMWAETDDREEYVAMAEADKERYEAEMEEYRQGKWSPSESDKSSTSKVKGVRKRLRVVKGSTRLTRKTKSSPKKKSSTKRAPSAYMIFCRETRHEIVDDKGEKLPLGETTKRLAQMWKELDTGTRAKFDAMAAEEKESLLVAS